MPAISEQFELIVGLGNPGPNYAQTRHNAGFWLLDRIAEHFNQSFRQDTKFSGERIQIQHKGREIHLLKPSTFINRSGQPVAKLAHYYKIPAEKILIAHDELDLEPGITRLKRQGGHGGHNGLRDLISQLGSREFWRLRIGIGHPGHRDQVVDYVLNKPRKHEALEIDRALDNTMISLPDILSGRLEQAMQQLHT